MKLFIAILLWASIYTTNALAQPRETEARPLDDSIFKSYINTFQPTPHESNIKTVLSKMAFLECRKDQPIHILFYGQSITEQGWWKRLAEYLTTEYKGVDFIFENKAIGGHPVDMLLKTAESDIYRFNPDLIIFHAYGSHIQYESLIQNIRERTTSDVIIATDHITKDQQLSEDTTPWKLAIWRYTRWFSWYWNTKPNYQWEAWMNYEFLPALALKYKIELVDIRSQWKNYLTANKMKSKQLLIDEVHLNANGEYLMAEIMKTHLAKRFSNRESCFEKNVTEIASDKIKLSVDGTYQFKMEGSRLQLTLDKATPLPISIYVDGTPPSKHFSDYQFTRSSSYPGTPWPALLQIHKGRSDPKEETWSACVEPSAPGSDWHTFDLQGSKTGFDGKGQTNKNFTSNSLLISIESEDWNLNYTERVWSKKIDKRTCFTWDSLSPGTDTVSPLSQHSVEAVAFTGLSNEEHTITLKGGNMSSIKRILAFHPPMKCLKFSSFRSCYFN